MVTAPQGTIRVNLDRVRPRQQHPEPRRQAHPGSGELAPGQAHSVTFPITVFPPTDRDQRDALRQIAVGYRWSAINPLP